MRMDAYYYGFDDTGEQLVDVVLSAVACAGKAYHNTSEWNEDHEPYEPEHRGANFIEHIQNAANDAAKEMAGLRANYIAALERIRELESALVEKTSQLKVEQTSHAAIVRKLSSAMGPFNGSWMDAAMERLNERSRQLEELTKARLTRERVALGYTNLGSEHITESEADNVEG